MTTYERIAKLCKKKGIAITALEKELGFGRGLIGKWQNKTSPNTTKLQKIADYFNVTMDYLVTGKETEWNPGLTKKDEKDIKKKLDDIRNQLASDTGLMYDGEPIDEESQEAILAAIEVAERTAILEAKRKFTPNKYKK